MIDTRPKWGRIVERFDPFDGYERFVCRTLDLDALRAADVQVLVEPMWGAGAGWISRLRPDAWPAPEAGLVTGDEAIARYQARIDELELSCFRCAD